MNVWFECTLTFGSIFRLIMFQTSSVRAEDGSYSCLGSIQLFTRTETKQGIF